MVAIRLQAAVLIAFISLLIAAAADPPATLDDLTRRLQLLDVRRLSGELHSVPRGTTITAKAFVADARKMRGKDPEYVKRAATRAEELIAAAEEGRDGLANQRGMFWRGYRSLHNPNPLFYSIYVPDSYDGTRAYPMIVTLHGGSSNHNTWLAMMLGNNLAPPEYAPNFRTRYKAQVHPEAIVVAPDGLGQVRWRWAGEQDPLDVIADVERNYKVDRDRITLTGLSNGGIGSYTVGLKYASRFAAVLPLAGLTHWPSYLGSSTLRPSEKTVLENESAITYAENAFMTDLTFFHGVRDPGMKVDQARRLSTLLTKLGASFTYKEFSELGHDLSHLLWRDLSIMKVVERSIRKRTPTDVHLVTASARANRQAWLRLDDRLDHTKPGRLHAVVGDDGMVAIEVSNAQQISLLGDDFPVNGKIIVRINGEAAYEGPAPSKKPVVLFAAGEDLRWEVYNDRTPAPGTRKTAGLCGPIGDANFLPQVHVYGSLVPEDIAPLRKAAELGARAFMQSREHSDVRHPVIRDTDLSDDAARRRVVVLYGSAANNAVLARLGDQLPIPVVPGGIELRGQLLTDPTVGARFVCPDPEHPSKYLLVNAANSAEAVERGVWNLPLYLPDYVVYNGKTTARRASMYLGHQKEIEMGFFDENWELPEPPTPPSP